MIAEIVMLAIGIALGSLATWLILKTKIQAAADKATFTSEAERAGLNATLQARDLQIQGLNISLERAEGESARLQTELTSEATQRATAEEKSIRIPTLEAQLAEEETNLFNLNTEVTQLKEAQATLATTIQEEHKAAEEKLAQIQELNAALEKANGESARLQTELTS